MRFANEGTSDIANRLKTKAAAKVLPVALHAIAARKLDLVLFATAVEDLRVPPGNQLEVLKGDRKGQYSIRINQKYRVCFEWVKSQAQGIEIVDYH